ncbi:NADPH-dependent glutamate synthase [Thermogladius sp. 4427co]|uniref:NADPH-dependent glutamate synthase n=1 Tax=Thermogladius sp. 4427co TaxID=3450718 RepID=UPI003F78F71E
MSRVVKTRFPPRVRPPEYRIKDFDEVILGYDYETAVKEASRCLKCPLWFAPCSKACPVNTKIPAFIEGIVKGDLESAARAVFEENLFPSITGRVCPQEWFCEKDCILRRLGDPVGIGLLERFIGDYARENGLEERILRDMKSKYSGNKGRVAIVGSGPAGLSAGGWLSIMGYEVDVYEALHTAGGVLAYGIPEFRLPKKILESEIRKLEELGVRFIYNTVVGKTITLSELVQEYDAVFIGTGAGTPRFLEVPGANLNNVYSANEFLTRVNLMRANLFPEWDTPVKVGKKTVVIGGGNTAIDSARVALRMGSMPVIVYRRDREDMLKTARHDEVVNAEAEGVEFKYYLQPVEFVGDENGFVKAVRFEVMEPTMELDERGKKKIKGTGKIVEIPADTVIIAIGLEPNKVLMESEGLKFREDGTIIVDEKLMTSIPGVFAGGDAIRGEATVVEAMADGKKAAFNIHEYIKSRKK